MSASMALSIAAWDQAATLLGPDHVSHGSAVRGPEAFDSSGVVDAARVAAVAPPETYPRILDFGCGSGRVLSALPAYGYHATGCETSWTMARAAERRLGFRRTFVDVLPTWEVRQGHQFDVVLALNVLGHVPKRDLGPMFALIHGLLRPGGRFVFNLPFVDDPYENEVTVGCPEVVQGWTVAEFTTATAGWGDAWLQRCVPFEEHPALSWLDRT